jgi:hypothetical protein
VMSWPSKRRRRSNTKKQTGTWRSDVGAVTAKQSHFAAIEKSHAALAVVLGLNGEIGEALRWLAGAAQSLPPLLAFTVCPGLVPGIDPGSLVACEESLVAGPARACPR